MSKPKKWIKARSIDQITAGARVRFTHYESAPVEFTALAVNIGVVWAPTEHSFNFDREGRTWYVRNPEWTKPKKIDGLHEGHSAKHWHRRWGISVEYNRTLAVTIRELEARIAELEAAPAPEPVMPEEPPVGTFFRVDRTGSAYVRLTGSAYYYCFDSIEGELSWRRWCSVVQPGDTITPLELRPVGEGNE